MTPMNSQPTVRAATEDDLPLLRQFQQAIVAAERPFDPTLRRGEVRYYDLDALLTRPDACLLVAVDGGQVIGSGYARLAAAEPFLQHAHYAHLGFMYVEPDYRGRGINAQIIAGLKLWAGAQGVTELRLKVYAPNAPARQAYEKFGFVPHLLEMRMGA
jgi:GNAT superfamily N-acetyltransferase